MATNPSASVAADTPPPSLKRLPVLLRRAWYGLNQAFRQRVAHLEVTPDQFSILRWLSEGDPQGLTQRALTDLMASDPNTITSTLSRMEKAGLIARQPHELDRRAHRVTLHPAGRRTFEQGRKMAVELQEQVLAALPLERRESFLQELESIAEACATAADRATVRKGRPPAVEGSALSPQPRQKG
ncbi:MAG TPA: MarR family winged helix-turn-helix transcriptional regulator [Chthoniobacteraceae bacterium]|jgi:DNA-binding MarR family transcriptional regulator